MTRRRERLLEDREFLLDVGPDFRRASDPFADRAGHRGYREAQRADTDQDDEDGRDPWRYAAAARGLHQRRERERDDTGRKDR